MPDAPETNGTSPDPARGADTTADRDRIDRFVLGKWCGIPLFLGIMYLMFLFTINIGGAFIDFFDGIAGALFVWLFTLTQNRWKIDDVLGVWPLHGLCGAWGGIACGIFGSTALGGLGGISFAAQLAGTALGIAIALIGGVLVYGIIKAVVGLRLSEEQEFQGADLSIHRIAASPDYDRVVSE